MDQFEEMRDMAKQVDALGDEPPEFKEAEVDAVEPMVTDPDPAPAPPAGTPVEEATTGGLGSTLETEDDEGLTIDKLLGLDEPSEAKETPKQDAQPPAPEESDAPAPDSSEARIKELSADKGRLTEQVDLLMRKALADKPTETPAGGAAPKVDLDPEVTEWLKDYVEELTGGKFEELRRDVEPMRDKAESEKLVEFIGDEVEGFKPEHLPMLYKELESMPEDKQPLYKGVQGAMILAQRLASRGALGETKKTTKRTSPLAARHQTESTDATPIQSDDTKAEEQLRLINDLSGDDVRNLVSRLGG